MLRKWHFSKHFQTTIFSIWMYFVASRVYITEATLQAVLELHHTTYCLCSPAFSAQHSTKLNISSIRAIVYRSSHFFSRWLISHSIDEDNQIEKLFPKFSKYDWIQALPRKICAQNIILQEKHEVFSYPLPPRFHVYYIYIHSFMYAYTYHLKVSNHTFRLGSPNPT